MDPNTLVGPLTAVLAPAIPYLVSKAGDVAASEAIKKLGKAAWEAAGKVWARLWPKIEGTGGPRQALDVLAATPADADAQGALRMHLKQVLAQDPALAGDIAALLDEARRAGVAVAAIGERSVGIGGDASGATIVSGDGNVVG
jgi:hypothetical protein